MNSNPPPLLISLNVPNFFLFPVPIPPPSPAPAHFQPLPPFLSDSQCTPSISVAFACALPTSKIPLLPLIPKCTHIPQSWTWMCSSVPSSLLPSGLQTHPGAPLRRVHRPLIAVIIGRWNLPCRSPHRAVNCLRAGTEFISRIWHSAWHAVVAQ